MCAVIRHTSAASDDSSDVSVGRRWTPFSFLDRDRHGFSSARIRDRLVTAERDCDLTVGSPYVWALFGSWLALMRRTALGQQTDTPRGAPLRAVAPRRS